MNSQFLTSQPIIGLNLRVIYCDGDLVEVRTQCNNGTFGGSNRMYLPLGALGEFGDRINGFPENIADKREVELGTFDERYAGGGLRLRLYCVDGAGHIRLEVGLREGGAPDGVSQIVHMVLAVEPWAIDSFVEGLKSMAEPVVGAEASLLCRLEVV